MPRREPKRLDKMPDDGRVLVAHPSREAAAIKKAREEMCDYRLSPWVPEHSVYVMNLDQINAPAFDSLSSRGGR